MSPLIFFVTLFRVQEDTDINTITISKAENRKNLYMLMRKYSQVIQGNLNYI